MRETDLLLVNFKVFACPVPCKIDFSSLTGNIPIHVNGHNVGAMEGGTALRSSVQDYKHSRQPGNRMTLGRECRFHPYLNDDSM